MRFPAEDYRSMTRLTKEQEAYNELWPSLRDVQDGSLALPFLAIAFKPRVPVDSRGVRGRCPEFSLERTLVPADQISVVVMQRVPTNHWRGANRRNRFRLNLVELPFIVAEDGELHVAACELERASAQPQYDFALNPCQDGVDFAAVDWRPDQLIAQPEVQQLVALGDGECRVIDDALGIEIRVNGKPMYRIPREFARSVVLREDLAGATVAHGESLGELVGEITLGVAEKKANGELRKFRVEPPCLSATRKAHLYRLANKMLAGMLDAAKAAEDPEREPPTPVEAWAPGHVAEFSRKIFAGLTLREEWSESRELLDAFRGELGPRGSFYFRSPNPAAMVFVEERELPDKRELEFAEVDGGEVVVIEIPLCARRLESVAPGATVTGGEPIADWAVRRSRESDEDLKAELGAAWGLVLRAFLLHVAERTGAGYVGASSLLIPAKFVTSVLTFSARPWVNTTALNPRLDLETGCYIPSAISQPDWRDTMFTAEGIGYDSTPAGDKLTSGPITERRLEPAT